MIVRTPIPFREALARHEVRAVLPTNLSSAELRRLNNQILQRSFFSARTALETYLQGAKTRISELVEGTVDPATVRADLRRLLQELGYRPDPDERGSITDLSSDRRLDLVIKTNTEIAQGYGHWRQGQDEEVLDQWPAQELARVIETEQQRPWLERFRLAGESTGARIGEGWTITPEGRMVALKNHAIWQALGSAELFEDALGNPYPPFAFNSGMDVRDVDREEAMEIGLIDRDTRVEPVFSEFGVEG